MAAPSTISYVLFAFVLIGCGSHDSTTQNPDFSAAKQRWSDANVQDYQFTLRTICYCLPESDIVVSVKGGVIDTAFYKDTESPVSAERLQAVPTVNGLFDKIEDAYANNAALVQVTYNGTYGYPEDVFIDYSSNLADEEFRYQVTDFLL